MRWNRGFTLLEILVVLTIMTIGAAAVMPSVARLAAAGSLRVVTSKIISSLRRSHRQAMLSGKTLSLSPQSVVRLPARFRLTTTADEIVFFPDGTALQVNLKVYDKHGRYNTVRINPFSGLASLTSF